MVFGESTRSRSHSRSFSVCLEIIQEVDSYKHLGVLRLVSTSGSLRICSAGGSSVGVRFHLLYSSLCLLYGSELWSLTKSDLNMLERTHRKLLRTIQGLPTRCPSLALSSSLEISALVDCRQLCFINMHVFRRSPEEDYGSRRLSIKNMVHTRLISLLPFTLVYDRKREK